MQSKTISMLWNMGYVHFPRFIIQKINTFHALKHRKQTLSVFQTWNVNIGNIITFSPKVSTFCVLNAEKLIKIHKYPSKIASNFQKMGWNQSLWATWRKQILKFSCYSHLKSTGIFYTLQGMPDLFYWVSFQI